jgi:1-acyl-sn-glycerol-3-phosphate acyltransferase
LYGIRWMADAVARTAAQCGPEQLAEAITGFLVRKSGISEAHVRPVVQRIVDEAGTDAVQRLSGRLSQPADTFSYYSGDQLARHVHHRLASVVLRKPPVVEHAAKLDAVRGRPAIIIANHLSYSDANVIEVLLHQAGQTELADRLAVIAGPKVYSDVTRRFSSLCFGTIKTPQNEQVSSGEAAMSSRDVAVAARQTLAAAQARLAAGDAIVLFPEGTRSRSGAMQPFLPGVARYFEDDDVMIVPIGLTGTEHMYGIGEGSIGNAAITMAIGTPITAGEVRQRAGDGRREFMDLLGAAVAEVLPPQYRGAYA